MPGDGHALVRSTRTRSRSQSGPGPQSGELPRQELDSELESAGESDSESEARPQRASKLHLICPGCKKQFADRSCLRRHRSSSRMADPACRNAANKRPRTVRLAVDSQSARDAHDRIQRMMGDGSNRGLPARDAQSPFLQPRDEVDPADNRQLLGITC